MSKEVVPTLEDAKQIHLTPTAVVSGLTGRYLHWSGMDPGNTAAALSVGTFD